MRILLLAPYFHPYNNPRAARWTAIAEVWEKQGIQVEVVTSLHHSAKEKNNIHRVGWASPGDRFRHQNSTSENPFWKKLYHLLFRSWTWPDTSFRWMTPAKRKALELLELNAYDALISVGLPFSTHLVGMAIKEKHPEINWLVDIGDPFSLQENHPLNNPFLYSKRNRRVEKKVLQLADKVVVTNTGALHLYREAFPGIAPSKMTVIPPLSRLLFPVPGTPISRHKKLRLAYFGRFFPGVREPAAFWPVLRDLQQQLDFDLTIYGDTSGMAGALKDGPLKYQVHPILPAEQVAQLMIESDVLLSLGNNTRFQLPSKTADYICSGRPVLHLAQLEEDPAKALLKELPQAFIQPVNSTSLENCVAFLKGAKEGKSKGEKAGRELFQPKEIAAAYLRLLAPDD